MRPSKMGLLLTRVLTITVGAMHFDMVEMGNRPFVWRVAFIAAIPRPALQGKSNIVERKG